YTVRPRQDTVGRPARVTNRRALKGLAPPRRRHASCFEGKQEVAGASPGGGGDGGLRSGRGRRVGAVGPRGAPRRDVRASVLTRVEIQSGTFQLRDREEIRGWCVGTSALPSVDDDAASEPRRG